MAKKTPGEKIKLAEKENQLLFYTKNLPEIPGRLILRKK